jgi:hypothetical protein
MNVYHVNCCVRQPFFTADGIGVGRGLVPARAKDCIPDGYTVYNVVVAITTSEPEHVVTATALNIIAESTILDKNGLDIVVCRNAVLSLVDRAFLNYDIVDTSSRRNCVRRRIRCKKSIAANAIDDAINDLVVVNQNI